MAEEAKTENMRWQQIGGLLTTVAGVAAPSIMNAVTGGAGGLGPQATPMAQPHQQQAQYPPQQQQVDEPGVRYATLRCDRCGKTFEVKSDANGAFGNKVRCPHCKNILEVDLTGFQADTG
jgi:predicted Zn finger-like uncharacterized protein